MFGRDGALWEIPRTDTGSARRLTSLDRDTGERAHAWPTVVSEGKAVLFTTLTAGPRVAMRIDGLARATGERRIVVDSGSYPMYASSGHLVFFRDNALLAAPFDVDALKLTGPPAVVVENIALGQLGSHGSAIEWSGNRMMAVVSTRGGDIVLSQPRVLFEQRYAFGGAQTVANYDVSPDGQRFVIVRDESASGRLNVVLSWIGVAAVAATALDPVFGRLSDRWSGRRLTMIGGFLFEQLGFARLTLMWMSLVLATTILLARKSA